MPVAELVFKVGIVVKSDHLQAQFHVINPADNELLAMRSLPHVSLHDDTSAVVEFFGRALEDLFQHVETF